MRWNVTSRRQVYGSEWVNVWIDEVETSGQRFEHHVLRMPKRTVSVVVVDDDRALLLWRHRFITDTWGWESSLQMHTFLGTEVKQVGPVQDTIESTRVEWIPLSAVPELAMKGEIADGPSLTGLTYYLATRSTPG